MAISQAAALQLRAVLVVAASCWSAPAAAMNLKEAVDLAVHSNPEIGAAIQNWSAVGYEVDQAYGLFLPSLDIEARSGAQQLSNPSTRTTGKDDDTLWRSEANAVLSQLLFDGFEASGEVDRQEARLDGASHRVFERSEFIALNVAREYLEVIRLTQIVGLAQQNIAYHDRVLGDMSEGARTGVIGVADRQQAEERLIAARARLIEFRESLSSSKIRFLNLVGKPIGRAYGPARRLHLPLKLDDALQTARSENPTIKIQSAEIVAAEALKTKAQSEYFPKVTLEASARAGEDIDGVEGRETDLRLEVVARWNIFRGGIDTANINEQESRINEETYRLHKVHRDVDEAVRLSWETRRRQADRVSQLRDQLNLANQLIGSYEEELKIGSRSLLDVLDTQNTRFNTQVTLETARAALTFSEYRLLASMGVLLNRLGVARPVLARD